jgi:outer membrane protein TolC
MKAPFLLILLAACARAEVHTLTLRQALDRALRQNPDVLLARFEEQKARAQVSMTGDPFSLKLGVGSGIAYTQGFPASIDGNAPSIFQAQARRALFDRPQTYRVAQANEAAKGAGMEITLRQEEAAYRVYAAFLDAEQAARSAESARIQAQNLDRVKAQVDLLVAEGREYPIASERASINVLTARNLADRFNTAQSNAEILLAQILGYPAGDQVRPALEDRAALAAPRSEDETIAAALAASTEVRRLESDLSAKMLEVKSYEAERLPKINLISQYSLLARFNNFDKFYPRFQRNNFQIGASIEIPVFTGDAPKAGKAAAQADIDKIRVELERTRSRIAGDLKMAYNSARLAESTLALARQDLTVARNEVTLLLERAAEGRATNGQVEAARAAEQSKWVAFYDAQHAAELARLNVLRMSGTLLAAVR